MTNMAMILLEEDNGIYETHLFEPNKNFNTTVAYKNTLKFNL